MASIVDEYDGWKVWQDMDGNYHVLDPQDSIKFTSSDSVECKDKMRELAKQSACVLKD